MQLQQFDQHQKIKMKLNFYPHYHLLLQLHPTYLNLHFHMMQYHEKELQLVNTIYIFLIFVDLLR
ncbi:MAG: hypothetical protein CMO04_13680 [Thalassospira sp.]|nr:hypothetical protein [Thalassospira sp.]